VTAVLRSPAEVDRLGGHRVRFRGPRGDVRTGTVEGAYAWDVPRYLDEHGDALGDGGYTAFVKIRQHNGVIERKASDVLAVADVRPKTRHRRCCT
jgi:hypothetical protein